MGPVLYLFERCAFLMCRSILIWKSRFFTVWNLRNFTKFFVRKFENQNEVFSYRDGIGNAIGADEPLDGFAAVDVDEDEVAEDSSSDGFILDDLLRR